MTDDKWQETTTRVKKMFTVLEEGEEELEDRPGTRTFLSFLGPGDQKMRVERLRYHPVIDKKTMGSRRIGSQATVEYRYNEEETIDRLAVSKWNDTKEQWEEVREQRFFS